MYKGQLTPNHKKCPECLNTHQYQFPMHHGRPVLKISSISIHTFSVMLRTYRHTKVHKKQSNDGENKASSTEVVTDGKMEPCILIKYNRNRHDYVDGKWETVVLSKSKHYLRCENKANKMKYEYIMKCWDIVKYFRIKRIKDNGKRVHHIMSNLQNNCHLNQFPNSGLTYRREVVNRRHQTGTISW